MPPAILFAEHAHRLFVLAETGELELFVSALSFSNLYYILRKLNGRAEALALLPKLKLLTTVCSASETDVDNALSSDFKDFEDALQHSAAKSAQLNLILTRNKADFAGSEIAVLTPDEFVTAFEIARGA